MELQFEKIGFQYQDCVVSEIQNIEQTQEIKLSDGMPDIGRVLGAWGQIIMRGKEWRADSFLFSGGIMAWVLYYPEGGDGPRSISSWIPFQMTWDLPPELPDGKIKIYPVIRFIDARSVSPRKLIVRAGISARGEAFVPVEGYYYQPSIENQGVELLSVNQSVCLPKESGEKIFNVEEELHVSLGASEGNELVYYTFSTEITDQKVLGNKLAFRGNGMLHVVFSCGDGNVIAQDYVVPFSQFSELEAMYGSDADASIQLCAVNLEADIIDTDAISLKASVTAQYTITDKFSLELLEDAYIPGKKIEMKMDSLHLANYSSRKRDVITGDVSIKNGMGNMIDASVFADIPKQYPSDNGTELESSAMLQMLYYDEENVLQSTATQVQCSMQIPGNNSFQVDAFPMHCSVPNIPGNPNMRLEIPIEMQLKAESDLTMIANVETGDEIESAELKPSLILMRAGNESLWSIAKRTGSTRSAIRKANNIEGEAQRGQILLIPVC